MQTWDIGYARSAYLERVGRGIIGPACDPPSSALRLARGARVALDSFTTLDARPDGHGPEHSAFP